MAITKNGTQRDGQVVGYWDYPTIHVNVAAQSIIIDLHGWISPQHKTDGKDSAVKTTYSIPFSAIQMDPALLGTLIGQIDGILADEGVSLDNLK